MCSKQYYTEFHSYQVKGVVGHNGLHKLEEGISDLIFIESELFLRVFLPIVILLIGNNVESLVDHV